MADMLTSEAHLQRRTCRLAAAAAAVEVVLASAAVLFDLLVPALVLVLLAAGSLLIRRQGLGSLGLRRADRPLRLVLAVLGLTVAWTGLQLSLVMPVLEHISGERQDVAVFADVEGNLGLALVLLGASWTLGALVEEIAFRGYLFTRLQQVAPAGRWSVVAAVLVSSALFGLAHTEQGFVGVGLTAFDALFFCGLRLRFRTLWAAVLAHGFNNTIGIAAYFLVGPFYGLW